MFRGNPSRSGTVNAKMPDVTTALWRRPTVLDKSDILDEVERVGEEAKQWINDTFDKKREFRCSWTRSHDCWIVRRLPQPNGHACRLLV